MADPGKKYILLVEDNPDDVTLTEMALRKGGVSHKLETLPDGEGALDFLYGLGEYVGRDLEDKPDLILLDLKLPRLDGLEVLERVHTDKRTADIPVVVLTSSAEERDQSESRRLGAVDYIRKPTSFTAFVHIIQQIKDQWLN